MKGGGEERGGCLWCSPQRCYSAIVILAQCLNPSLTANDQSGFPYYERERVQTALTQASACKNWFVKEPLSQSVDLTKMQKVLLG